MNRSTQEAEEWAISEFGGADLGDPRRTRRLVTLAARAANTPDGKVTSVCAGSAAELEGAYRLLRNEHFDNAAVSASAHMATARRCRHAEFAYAPIDGSSLQIIDEKDVRGLGVVGTRQKDARGLKVMTAIAVLPDGTPAGLGGQSYWIRPKRAPKALAQKRRLHEKETRYWLDVMDDMEDAFDQAGVNCTIWYQMDREGDFWQALQRGSSSRHWFTVRSKADRRLLGGGFLSTALDEAAIAGCFALDVPASRGRERRTAWMELRFASVTLEMKDAWTSERHSVILTVVNALEIGTTPLGEAPLHWRLLTNRPVHTAQDAWQVVFGYGQRWRVEEFHKTWKTGACNAEDTQLGSASAIIRWATILASVAMRIERLKYLARNDPESPASSELSPDEIDALVVLRKPKGVKRGYNPAIGEAVLWIAELGGYTGKSSGGPPGAIVIGRGLEKVQVAVELLHNLDDKM